MGRRRSLSLLLFLSVVTGALLIGQPRAQSAPSAALIYGWDALSAGAQAHLRSSASEPAVCDLVAAPRGSDEAPGTAEAPLASAASLVARLEPGQTGCLREGRYYEDVRMARSGASGAAITLTSFPGETATLRGRLWIDADHVQVAGLVLDGRNDASLPSPTVNGADVAFRHNDVHNGNSAICFVLGSVDGYGQAVRTVIEGNRIHNCGRLPATNHDHGIYVENAADVRIVHNAIFDNADRGVQLYPSAVRTYVADNVIDGNGEGVIFSGDGMRSSSDNIVERNFITNSRIRYDIEGFWPEGGLVGSGNLARHNCVFGGEAGVIQLPAVGFTAYGNAESDPVYVDRAAKDFRFREDCRPSA